jgi:hypothetical protein
MSVSKESRGRVVREEKVVNIRSGLDDGSESRSVRIGAS